MADKHPKGLILINLINPYASILSKIAANITPQGTAMQLTLEISDHYFQGKNQLQTARQIKLYAALLMFQSG